MTINEIQEEIVETFNRLEDWEEKYNYIITFGKNFPQMLDKYKTEENIIKGCQSLVWMHVSLDENQNIIFEGASDAAIVQGLIGLLIYTLSNHTPEEILNADLYFMNRIGIHQYLSPTRSNGIRAMIKKMMEYAQNYQKPIPVAQIHAGKYHDD